MTNSTRMGRHTDERSLMHQFVISEFLPPGRGGTPTSRSRLAPSTP